MAPNQLYAVGEVVDRNLGIQEPEGAGRSLIWDPQTPVQPQHLEEEVRQLLTEPWRSSTSRIYLLDQVRSVAFIIGSLLLERRSDTDIHAFAQDQVRTLVTQREALNAKHDIVIPLINLVLNVPEGRITLGPVEIISDRLDAYLFYGGDTAKLGEFGKWAVTHFHLEDHERKTDVPPTFHSVSSYAQFRSVPGDLQYAIQHARQDIGTALSILRMFSYRFGSWDDPHRFGSHGSYYDPIDRFGILGMPTGGATISLATEADTTEPAQIEQWDQTGIHMPVVIEDQILSKKMPMVEQLARHMWAKNGNWQELRLAVKLFNEGLDAPTADDAFLKFVIAMDVLLGKDEKGWAESQTTRLSERMAFLLGDQDPNKRWRIATNFKCLYSKRSAVVHDGASVTDRDVYRMESIARLAILRLLWEIERQGFINLDAYIDYVRRTKFGEVTHQGNIPDFVRLSTAWFS